MPFAQVGRHLRPILAEPLALADLAPHPPPLPLLKADDPLLFSCPPHPDELAFWVLFEFPLHPLPVFLYVFPFALAYLSPFALWPTAALLPFLPVAPYAEAPVELCI